MAFTQTTSNIQESSEIKIVTFTTTNHFPVTKYRLQSFANFPTTILPILTMYKIFQRRGFSLAEWKLCPNYESEFLRILLCWQIIVPGFIGFSSYAMAV